MKTEAGKKDFETMEDRGDELPRKNFESFALQRYRKNGKETE